MSCEFSHHPLGPRQWLMEMVFLPPAVCSAASSRWSTPNAIRRSRRVPAPWGHRPTWQPAGLDSVPSMTLGRSMNCGSKKWENGEENNFDNSLHGSQTLFSVEMTHRSSIAIHRVRPGLEHALCNRLLQKAPRELTEYCEDDRIHPRSESS